VHEKQPVLGEKGQYGYVRQPEERPKRNRRKVRTESSPSELDADPSSMDPVLTLGTERHDSLSEEMRMLQEGVYIPPGQIPMPSMPGIPMGMPMPGMMPPPHSTMQMAMHPAMQAMPLPLPNQSSIEVAQQSQASLREEVEDTDDVSQWPVRIGDDPPPNWAKRKTPEEVEEEEDARKRARIAYVLLS
jgi:hypothetical protein